MIERQKRFDARYVGAKPSSIPRVAVFHEKHVNWCDHETNIPLKIEADLLREARILAAEEGTSISAMVANQLEMVVRERKGHSQARRRALAACGKATTCAGHLRFLEMSFMSGKFFVDTNILIYAHDSSSGMKHQRARTLVEELWEAGTGVISTRVLQELCINLGRKLSRPLPVDKVRPLIQDYLEWEVVTDSPKLSASTRYKTSFWDALILQAAENSGAAILIPRTWREEKTTGQFRLLTRWSRVPITTASSKNPTRAKGWLECPMFSGDVGGSKP